MIPLPKLLLAAACSLALAGAAFAVESEHPKTDHDGMHRGGGRMGCQPDTGDADADFALRMRRLHERAAAMARREIAAGDDAAMKSLAQQMVDGHAGEVARIDAWLAANGVDRDASPDECGRHTHRFEQLDANGDGFIGHDELDDTHPLHQHFAMVDKNADGKVDRAELVAHHAAMRNGEEVPRLTAAPHPPMSPDVEAFASLDDNGDGYLVMTELTTSEMLYQHFAIADTDKDGKLSPAEVDAHHSAMHAQMKH